MQEQTHLVKKRNYKIVKKLLGAMLKQDKDELIRYNYPKLAAIDKLDRVYKTLENIQA